VYGSQCVIDLYARTARDGGDRIVRTARPEPGSGLVRFELRPTDHTLIWARTRFQPTANGGHSGEVRLEVARAVSLSAERVGTRRYVFSGAVAPKQGGLLVSLHRTDGSGRSVLTAQTRTGDDGAYRMVRTFTGSGRFAFFTTVAGDAVAGAGRSAARNLVLV
jgi:hypothetical protein